MFKNVEITDRIPALADNKLWFRAKYLGWGWTPVTWQGWLATALYVFLLTREFLRVDATSHSTSDTLIGFAIPMIAISGLFLLLCYARGEKPRWRWFK